MSTMMKTLGPRIAALLLVVGMVMIAAAERPAEAFEVKEVRSSKGVTAWLVEDHTIPLIAMNFSFAGGAAGDPADRAGLAYFLSGMLDEGAGKYDSAAFQKRTEELAMRLSYDASLDDFAGAFQTLSRNRDEAFEMLRLSINVPRFEKAPLERIRGQLLANRRQALVNPEQIAMTAWMKAMFGDHPYARRSRGTIEGLQAVSADDLAGLHKRLFTREGLMIVVVGDIDEETLKSLLDKTFGDLPVKSGMPKVAKAPVTKGPVVKIVDRNIPQSIIRFGHKGIMRDDKDFIPAYVVNHILGSGGFGSRLMEEVREKRGLSYGVYSALYPLDHAAVFFGGAATINARASETVEVLRAELARMAKDGPSEKELSDAKTYLTGSFALRFDSNSKIADNLLSLQRAKLGIDYVQKRNKLIEAVTLDEVRRVAARLLDAGDLVFAIVGKPEGIKPVGEPG